jgi:aminoglycoside/choline kinase family phosphotransferase
VSHKPTPPSGAADWIRDRCGGHAVRALEPIPGGAGRRRYWRARFDDLPNLVLMEAHAEDPAILPPQLRRPPVALPFVNVTRLLARHDLPVPELHAVDEERRWVLLEDLGGLHVLDLEPAEREGRTREAIELLARLHAIAPEPGAFPFDRRFDREWIAFELNLFLEQLKPKLRAALAPEFERLAQEIEALPACLCMRDYQSHNLMIDPSGRLRVIDYQDALLAPPELDLASLLDDSYVAIEPRERRALLERYEQCSGRSVRPEPLALLTVQRKCKDLSRFRTVLARGDRRYEPALRAARGSVLTALAELPAAHAGLAERLADALEPAPGESSH